MNMQAAVCGLLHYCLQILWQASVSLHVLYAAPYVSLSWRAHILLVAASVWMCVWSLCGTAPPSISSHSPSVFHISFFSTHPPSPTSALYFFSLFSSLLSSSPLLGPDPAPSLQYVFSDEWGHWLAASSGASRAQVLRAQSVKWHGGPLHCYSVSSAFLQSVLCETWSFSKDTLVPTVGQQHILLSEYSCSGQRIQPFIGHLVKFPFFTQGDISRLFLTFVTFHSLSSLCCQSKFGTCTSSWDSIYVFGPVILKTISKI